MAEEATAPTIGVTDLESCVKIIDACTQRGAFKGDELTSVGTVRDRLVAFVEANTPKPKEEDQMEMDLQEGGEDAGTTN